MRLLLDSHVFVRAKAKPENLNVQTRAAIADPENELFVSVVSAWELWVKHAKRPIAPVLDGGPRRWLNRAWRFWTFAWNMWLPLRRFRFTTAIRSTAC
jgi:PIN domain nuclease of toxin-antitoxin system